MKRDMTVVIKGAGEMATGIAHRLYRAQIKRILMTEIPEPLSVRRTVCLSEAVYDGVKEVEGVIGRLIFDVKEAEETWKKGEIGIIIDPGWASIEALKPDVVVDAIMAKRNIGTKISEAPLVIGVGPGFSAPRDVHAVIESNRGHDLGRVIYDGEAEPHTGIPGFIGVQGEKRGYTSERVLRSPHEGMIRHVKQIGDPVKKGETAILVDETPVVATIDGMLRGLIRQVLVTANEKVGDVDPRGKREYCFTITEKARAIGGGVLEAIAHVYNG